MVVEVYESGRLMKMVSGSSWLERVGCQPLCCLTKLSQHLEHRLQIIRQVNQILWHKYANDSLLFKNKIHSISESMTQMAVTEGISHECESFPSYMAHC